MLRDSTDEYGSRAGSKLRSGRKWKVEVKSAEERLRHSDIIGTVTHGRLWLGCVTRSRFSTASSQRRRELVQDEVRQEEEKAHMTKAVAEKKQGSWFRWESVRAKKIPWDELWRMTKARGIRFAISSVYDIWPTPTNLCTWKMSDDPLCKLCGKKATLEQILSFCSRALADGGYTWRHNQVLEVLAIGLDKARRKCSANGEKGPPVHQFCQKDSRKARKAREDRGRRHPGNKK